MAATTSSSSSRALSCFSARPRVGAAARRCGRGRRGTRTPPRAPSPRSPLTAAAGGRHHDDDGRCDVDTLSPSLARPRACARPRVAAPSSSATSARRWRWSFRRGARRSGAARAPRRLAARRRALALARRLDGEEALASLALAPGREIPVEIELGKVWGIPVPQVTSRRLARANARGVSPVGVSLAAAREGTRAHARRLLGRGPPACAVSSKGTRRTSRRIAASTRSCCRRSIASCGASP
jgi:hypothetical protein